MNHAGYYHNNSLAQAGPLGDRLGPRQLEPEDARYRLDQIYESEELDRQGPPGPRYFGPRVMATPTKLGFQLARGMKTYNGSTKPEDFINDYLTTVFVAG